MSTVRNLIVTSKVNIKLIQQKRGCLFLWTWGQRLTVKYVVCKILFKWLASLTKNLKYYLIFQRHSFLSKRFFTTKIDLKLSFTPQIFKLAIQKLRWYQVKGHQAEVHAVERFVERNMDSNYNGQDIAVMPDSQTVIRGLRLPVFILRWLRNA